jgi:hypothetical protein
MQVAPFRQVPPGQHHRPGRHHAGSGCLHTGGVGGQFGVHLFGLGAPSSV